MTKREAPQATPGDPAYLKLERAKFDPQSVQAQMALGAALILLTCLVVAAPDILGGFAAADRKPQTISAEAIARDIPSLMQHITSFTSIDYCGYQPFFVITLIGEHFLFYHSAAGYHLFNALLLAWCCIAASLTVLEITGRFGNKLGACPAIWAGLLIAAVPPDRSLLTNIADQQWLLADALTMTAVFGLLRYRLVGQTHYYVIAMFSFVMCILTNETATCFLPIVLTAFWLFAVGIETKRAGNWKTELRLAAKLLAPCWFASAVYIMARANWAQHIPPHPAHFFWIAKLFCELQFNNIWAAICPASTPPGLVASVALCAVLVLSALRLKVLGIAWQIFLLLLLWIDVSAFGPLGAALPQEHTWSEVYTPFPVICIFIALAALPALDRLRKTPNIWLTAAGTCCLLAIFFSWLLI